MGNIFGSLRRTENRAESMKLKESDDMRAPLAREFRNLLSNTAARRGGCLCQCLEVGAGHYRFVRRYLEHHFGAARKQRKKSPGAVS
jgi:hypothetical protein